MVNWDLPVFRPDAGSAAGSVADYGTDFEAVFLPHPDSICRGLAGLLHVSIAPVCDHFLIWDQLWGQL